MILAKVPGKLKFTESTHSTYPFAVKISTWVNQNFLLYKMNCIICREETLNILLFKSYTNVTLFVLRREISIVSIELLNCQIVCIYFWNIYSSLMILSSYYHTPWGIHFDFVALWCLSHHESTKLDMSWTPSGFIIFQRVSKPQRKWNCCNLFKWNKHIQSALRLFSE